ncbi:hypothetical protein F0562_019063 [Nyssa sinensis]|uniref:Fe2OG dioxygenase domain-containing protein n=1 Tax=Nyssa sinensis TaxID=561372 RepID=A0A5J4ZDL5_9ASTE|nr:hypothetical protein F0562_019063 [Nyssa sinensis]
MDFKTSQISCGQMETDHFCETMLSYAKLVSELEQKVNRMVFESYGVEKNYESHVGSTTYLLRVMKYRAPQMDESEVGSQTHTDKSFITILHQNQVNALEVQARNGQWIAVDFPLASFVVMAGDAYMAWSNDRIHAPRHQVNMSGNKSRYANGTIFIPQRDSTDTRRASG